MSVTSPARAGTVAVLAGGALSSLAAYAFQILGARALGDAAYAPVGILWTLQYLVLTIGLLSVEAHVTRRAGVSPGVWRWIGALTVAVTLATALAGGLLFTTHSPAWPLTAAAIVVGFGLFAIVRGEAAARGDFRGYGLLTGGESVVRLLLAALLLGTGAQTVGLALTLPTGVLVVSLAYAIRRRPVTVARGAPGSATGVFFAVTTVANGVAQVLLAAGPLVVAALGADPATTTIVFVTTTAARAPLVFIHSGALAKVLPPMRRMLADGRQAHLRRRVLKASAAGFAGVLAAGAAGAAVGPPLVAIAFGQDLRPPVLLGALTAVSVALTMVALVLNQVAIALDAQGLLLWPWLVALAAGALGLVLSGPDPVTQVAVASAGGLAVATVGVLATVVHRLGQPTAAVT